MCYAATGESPFHHTSGGRSRSSEIPALCCYDYCLTFEREVVLMWRDKLTAASALFYALRYAALLNTILILLGYLSWPGWQTAHVLLIVRNRKSCMIIMRLQMAGDVLILTCVAGNSCAAFATMRIYALFRRSWALSYLILALSLVNPAISMYTFIISTPILLQVTPTYQTCSIDTPYASNLMLVHLARPGMMGARASAVVSDSLVLFLTWRGTRHVAASELRTILMSHSKSRIWYATRRSLTQVSALPAAVYFGYDNFAWGIEHIFDQFHRHPSLTGSCSF
ncbi:uncharacterized protein C8Q71DRAFT_708355 [Rhodofomes roseus]|uniref:DUF6533 domain-containing protein n=1 Tax=Rhodofomes roseus TaxID=34475 RepID=A0ABQ8KFI9_9APHY|nr:uncharacterized protein C8Q71DRAFT_708355 [Rhodofomes roseus]KAH9836389.1 hypothetical protein C8Q71DRAFT_708355 [Rhodofomes roseus]